MKKEDVDFLEQAAKTLEQAEEKLEEFYRWGDSDKFDRTKKLILQIQRKISEVIK